MNVTPPMNTSDFGLQSKGNLPFAYPNSEYIAPPVKKEPTRVVEPSTRAEVVLNAWLDKQDRLEQQIDDLRLQTYFKKQEIQQGSVIDIEV
jgi:hypothetical protein